MRTLLIATVLAVAMGTAASDAASIIEGQAVVLDGDTVVVAGVTVRLKGIDAPEQADRYGPAATEGMRAIAGKWLRCNLTGEKTRNREVGFCDNAAGQDIGEAIVKKGLALACERYSIRYVEFEQPEALKRLTRASYCNPKKKIIAQAPMPVPPPSTGKCQAIKCKTSDDIDSLGRRCGKRAASERPGGC